MTIIPVFLLWAFGKSGLDGKKWSAADRPLFPSATDRQHRKRAGSYRPLLSGNPTFRNRPDLGIQDGKADGMHLGIEKLRLKV